MKFSMSAKSFEVHTATFGPGNPETEPTSLPRRTWRITSPRTRRSPSQAVYPSDPPPAGPAALTPTLHGNGFWNSRRPRRRQGDAAAAVERGDVRGTRDVQLLLHDPPVHARDGRRPVRRAATIVALLAVTGAATSVAAPAASAATREFWVAAVPAPTWNMSPNERDAIHGMPLSPSQTVFPTVVYRRYSAALGPPDAQHRRGHEQPGPHPRTAAARAGRRLAARPLQEHGHALQAPALHALPRRALPAQLGRRLRARASRAATATSSRARRGPTS